MIWLITVLVSFHIPLYLEGGMSCSSVTFVSSFFFPLLYLIQAEAAQWPLFPASRQAARQPAEQVHPDWFILAESSDFLFIVLGSEGNYW